MNVSGTKSSIANWALDTSTQDLYAVEKIFSNGKRWMYRHRSQMGTVIEFNDGAPKKVLVLDAKYRMSGLNNDIIGPYDFNDNVVYKNHSTIMHVFPTQCDGAIDSIINQYSWEDYNSSHDNTTVMLWSDSEVAQYTRSILVNGRGCDVPNFQTLQRIFCEGVLLDSLDPTVEQYPQYALSNWFNDGMVWSSSEFGIQNKDTVVWGIHCLSVNMKTQIDNTLNYVIPVQEI